MKSYPANLGIDVNPAVCPPEALGRTRDDVKLLVIDRHTGQRQHAHLDAVAQFFRPGDLMVVNNSAAIAAALPARIGDSPAFLHLAARLGPTQAIVELRGADGAPNWSVLAPNTDLAILGPHGETLSRGSVVQHFHPRSRLWTVETETDWYTLTPQAGKPIRYHYVDHPYPIEAYQTIFGTVPGSSEMPSASRPFTPKIVELLQQHGVCLAELTLHTTVSSHELTEGEQDVPIVPEWFDIPEQTLKMVEEAKRDKRPIIALGTTVVRALETWAWTGRSHGWTTHLVTPEFAPRLTSGMITGLHDNFTSHLWLLYAFLPATQLRAAYQDARLRGYQWHEFGDLSLIR